MATSTPWGTSQHSKQLAPGIVSYMTASHGGIHLSKTRVAAMPETLRRFVSIENDGGVWLEEDCEWSIAALAFPDFFKDSIESAEKTLRGYNPYLWEAFYGRTLQPGESYSRDEKNFYLAHAADLLVTCAFGSWAEHVPTGKVGVFAVVGGDSRKGESYWLVDEAEYAARTHTPFVIDPERHQKLDVVLGAHKRRAA